MTEYNVNSTATAQRLLWDADDGSSTLWLGAATKF